ncbi:MAG: hypothetical protein A2822_04435 [Candidatus Staskawiczbacteria bacterium RIFCSPHIGHO2_01_FULL_41_41]|uniref:Uncharacterized protein n=1 Tax=Candidatus Staskawiczbacteria bacterium RIFCSPHIGHO2_01_FULL_41_41 TaxID=1802203 RepID=A0A1G2HU47_9BACT|nr:MAG: hypothetical protein A2822_04435 [Candidatus Staskawiczbacteria bacterium RIFCSPHIGHO2_01_FULL_41_41]
MIVINPEKLKIYWRNSVKEDPFNFFLNTQFSVKKMIKQGINSIEGLNGFLKNNRYWANGKSFPVDHLHATGAQSRWEYENVYGIYLTQPHFAWMAMWMGSTDRERVQKRNLTYVRPENGDWIGAIRIYSLDSGVKELYSKNGCFLYLFDPENYKEAQTIDLQKLSAQEKISYLLNNNFSRKEITRKGKSQSNIVSESLERTIIEIDSWQMTLVNVDVIRPDIEVHVESEVLKNLYGQRVLPANEISTENYIID